ncbi:hypothetical protein [Micromonospora sp. NPDC047730]|uniref:hypothetical protein n=1 Tax=Micromonospora sp. NPDC047730 TaxID=3364253 RepID=UPI00371F55D1
MARYMGKDDAEVFRAVIVTTYPAEPESDYPPHRVERKSTTHAGPYRTKGAARAAVERESRPARFWAEQGVTSEGYVEKASITWERVE